MLPTKFQFICLAKLTEIWWETPMEGSVLSFLKAEWKVNDTGSAHWASSYFIEYLPYMFPTKFWFIWLSSFRE
jgi:hypothetical protein